jgi:RNA polymerase sigma-70 factor (ECF subfamily)
MQDAERDDALLERLARTGDARAFDVLYRRHTGVLYSTAWRLTRDADVAADLVHDTWVRAVESARAFEQRSSFRTWITGILINRHREHERARRRESVEARDHGRVDDVVDPVSAAPLNGSGIDRIDLEAAIAALPPGFRQVLVLHDIEGFTHDEIAAALGLVPGTSKSQLARARQRVREMLSTGVPRTAT